MQNKKRNVHEHINDYQNYTVIDEERRNEKVYLYLCYLQEAKNWVSSVIEQEIRSIEEFESELQKGNILTELALRYAPNSVGKVFVDDTLQYRHTDNINFFLDSLREVKLPKVFYFGVLDCYEKKNIPNVIFCIHALAHYLAKIGKPLKIESLYGQKIFSQDEYESKERELKNVRIPRFNEIQNVISKETLGNLLAPIIKKRVYVAVQKRKKERMKSILEQEIERLEKERREEEERKKQEIEQARLQQEMKDIEDKISDNQDSNAPALSNDMSTKVKRKIANMHKSNIQSFLKTFIYRKSLNDILKNKPSLFAIRKFLFILNQNMDTLKIESEIEKYHMKIKEKLKENYLIESYIDQLEISIGLLMNNKVNISNMSKNKPTIDDVLSIYPLETGEYKFFQEFFYTLQTKPKYISKLLMAVPRKQAEDFIYNYAIPLFSHSKTQRDEYMIHKLVKDLFQRETAKNFESNKNLPNSELQNIESLLATLLVITHLRLNYGKFSESFAPVIAMVKDADIDCDPLSIARSLNLQVADRIEALSKKEIKSVYTKRILDFKNICNAMITAIENMIDALPFSVRYYVRLIESHDLYKTKAISFFFNECMVPFILAPDILGVKRASDFRNKEIRTKCYTITSFITNILTDRCFSRNENISLTEESVGEESRSGKTTISDFYFPLKEFIEESKERFSKIICRILDIDEYFTQNNNFRIHKPMVQFSGKEANSILYLFKKNIDAITTEDDVFYSQVAYADPLKYKNNHLITFFLNCAIEEEKQIYGEVKKNVIRALNESKECFKDLYELVHQYKQAGDSKSGENTLLKQFEELERKGVVSESKRYSEFLDILASDILTISSIRAQRMKELEINKSTFENTLKREEYLKKMRSNLEEHFYSFTEEIIVKNKGRDDSSKYGTYRYDLNSLKKQNVVKQMNDFADEDLQFVLSCDNPNVFKFELFVSNVKLAGTELRLDELLRMRYKGEDTFVVKKLIVVYVEGMIDLINEKYFKE